MNREIMHDCIDLIYSKSVSFPAHTCIIENDRSISYHDFFALATRVANYLVQYEATPKVVLNLKQGIDSYAVIVGTLLAGGCYCPLNLDSPDERKKWTIDQFCPHLIITQPDISLPAIANTTVKNVHDILNDQTDNTHSVESLLAITQSELAYIIYTSGSTGNPKGVMIKRRSLNAFLKWSIPAFNASEADRWGQYSSLSFDLSIVDIFTCLCSGATLVSLSDTGYKLRPSIAITKFQISIWHSVPGAIDFMMKSERSRPADLSSIRLMSFCGEPLLERHLVYLFDKNPGITVFNTYGPTEGTLFCTYLKVTSENYKTFIASNVSIGSPITGWNLDLQEYEGDKDLKQVIIYGDYVGVGYLGLNSEAFHEIMIGGMKKPAYNTGDLVSIHDNNLYFVGRKDNQIKLRGYRIELDEIDACVNRVSGLTSISLLHSDAIHTFVEVETLNEVALRNSLEGVLEKYKIPANIYAIESLPRNSNYKVNRKKLKEIIDGKQDS